MEALRTMRSWFRRRFNIPPPYRPFGVIYMVTMALGSTHKEALNAMNREAMIHRARWYAGDLVP